jgi:hypothetical protein
VANPVHCFFEMNWLHGESEAARRHNQGSWRTLKRHNTKHRFGSKMLFFGLDVLKFYCILFIDLGEDELKPCVCFFFQPE